MVLRSRATAAFAAGAVALLSPLATASAATILDGLYDLRNHPDGNAVPPPYGLRMDELFNATAGHDIFTFDFEAAGSAVFMTVDTGLGTIRIFGQALGGRDIGGAYAADSHLGIYSFDFLYNLGVGPVPGDDDLWVNTANRANSGIIVTPSNGAVNLVDERDSGYSFRLGDENDDAGHRGANGISGWGWMSYRDADGGVRHVNDTDWLFTASYRIPTPGAAALLGLAGLGLARRRR